MKLRCGLPFNICSWKKDGVCTKKDIICPYKYVDESADPEDTEE
jgi:hypothetical protein